MDHLARGICLGKKITELSYHVSSKLGASSGTLPKYQSCRDVVAAVYLRQKDDHAWPPVKATNFISLALIKDQRSWRKTMQQSVDEVLGDKECVSYAFILEGMDKSDDDAEDNIKTKENDNLILLQGRPGSGKTTLMNKFSSDWARKQILQSKLLLLIYLRQLNSQQHNDLTTILQQAFPALSLCDIEEIKKMNGKDVVLAFDGLDEYTPRKKKSDILFDLIKGKQLPEAKVIVTSRPAACTEFLQYASRQIEVIGFKREQTLEYINCYFADDEEKASQLIAHLQQYPNLMNVCYLPLHCAMLTYLYEETAFLPESETEFYKHFTLSTLLRSIRKRDDTLLTLSSFDDLPHNDKILFDKVCKMAFDTTVASKQVFSLSDLKSTSEASAIIKEEDSLGLVVIDRYFMKYGLDQTYTFIHLTFQEFLAAVYVAGLSESARMKIIDRYCNENHLSVVWKFLYGMMEFSSPQAMDIFKAIAPESDLLMKILYAYESQYPLLCSRIINSQVEFSDCTLSPSDCVAIGYVINRASHNIVDLSLKDCYVTPEGIVALLQQIGTRPFTLKLR